MGAGEGDVAARVPAGSGNRRVVEKALAALPGGIAKVYLRGDSALYEHELSCRLISAEIA